ncbi:MAG TPA: hypothetical protein PKH51_12160, partial [Candidatus Sumerlaeota bacterium]|nr:hypothetical protein [Candidatus Sumerlaeota bacterium]
MVYPQGLMSRDFEPVHIPRLQERGHLGIKCGLENIRALLEGLGRPDSGFPVVHIAGTAQYDPLMVVAE